MVIVQFAFRAAFATVELVALALFTALLGVVLYSVIKDGV
jgi:hypothetical protein